VRTQPHGAAPHGAAPHGAAPQVIAVASFYQHSAAIALESAGSSNGGDARRVVCVSPTASALREHCTALHCTALHCSLNSPQCKLTYLGSVTHLWHSYTWGWNVEAQLGHSDGKAAVYVPTPVAFRRQVSHPAVKRCTGLHSNPLAIAGRPGAAAGRCSLLDTSERVVRQSARPLHDRCPSHL
jgi:hypothetical protein